MNIVSPTADAPFYAESNASGVSWAAVIGGAFVTAAFALVLIILGVGFGLSWFRPRSGAGASSKAIGAGRDYLAHRDSGHRARLGGYLVGRLRRDGRPCIPTRFTSAIRRMAFSCGPSGWS